MFGFLEKLKSGLNKTSANIANNIAHAFTDRKLDDAALEELEETLLIADTGVAATNQIISDLRKEKFGKSVTLTEVKQFLSAKIATALSEVAKPLEIDPTKKPFVILMAGVNGSGKTTSIGKLAAGFKEKGLQVSMVAGDTFRAAAIEQLQEWGKKTAVPVFAGKSGADAASLIYDAFLQSKKNGDDVLLIDTAGRLQNKTDLMAELQKIINLIKKIDSSAPHARLLVLDAGIGQNALSQVEAFKNILDLNGIILTKLDGTAKGGMIVSLARTFKIPVNYITAGEGVDDIFPFIAKDYADILVGLK